MPSFPAQVLLVSTDARSVGAARAPRALAHAGFEVTLLAPRASLAQKSRAVKRVAHLPDPLTTEHWVHAFAASVRAVGPVLVIPADDTAFRLLSRLAVAPPPQMQPALHASLAALVRRSLGDPAHYEASVDAVSPMPGETRSDGDACVHHVAAWRGRLVAGYVGEPVEGQASLVRCRHDGPLGASSQRLVEALGIAGFASFEYRIEQGTGARRFVVHRGMNAPTYRSAALDVDLAAALHAAIHDAPGARRIGLAPNEERVFVPFPGAWLRDPAVETVGRHPVDAPWDDPALLDAMLAQYVDR